MSKEVTQTFSQFLIKNEALIKKQIANALPKHLSADKMLRVLMTELKRVPDLAKCTPQSIMSAIIQASQVGLEPGILGQCYLIPYRNNKLNTYECQFIIGYKGMIDLVRRSGQVVSISAHAVYENDILEFEYGIEEKLRHVPSQKESGRLIGAYAIARFSNTYDGRGTSDGISATQFEVMFKSDIEKIRSRSKSAGSSYSPWTTDYEEMAKKTAIRRLSKYLPISVEHMKVISSEEIYEKEGADIKELSYLTDGLIEDAEIVAPPAPSKADAIASKIEIKQQSKEATESIEEFANKL